MPLVYSLHHRGAVLFGTLWASFSKSFERFMQPFMTGGLVMAGGGIVWMTASLDSGQL